MRGRGLTSREDGRLACVLSLSDGTAYRPHQETSTTHFSLQQWGLRPTAPPSLNPAPLEIPRSPEPVYPGDVLHTG